MKFTNAASSLFLLATAFAVLSVDATSLRGGKLLTNGAPLTAVNGSFRRRLEETAQGDDNLIDDFVLTSSRRRMEENANQGNDDAAQGDDDASDDYVFYDDYAIQNCEDGDEDCEKAATYAAYDDNYLANCGEDDEDCNDAAAYMAAKQKKEEEEAVPDPWDYKTYTDKFNSMSRTSKIWTIVLAVWFSVLFIATCYLCCCRKGYKSQRPKKKSLRQSLMGGTSKRSSSSYDGDESVEERKRGRSKFRIFGRSKGRRSRSRNQDSY